MILAVLLEVESFGIGYWALRAIHEPWPEDRAKIDADHDLAIIEMMFISALTAHCMRWLSLENRRSYFDASISTGDRRWFCRKCYPNRSPLLKFHRRRIFAAIHFFHSPLMFLDVNRRFIVTEPKPILISLCFKVLTHVDFYWNQSKPFRFNCPDCRGDAVVSAFLLHIFFFCSVWNRIFLTKRISLCMFLFLSLWPFANSFPFGSFSFKNKHWLVVFVSCRYDFYFYYFFFLFRIRIDIGFLTCRVGMCRRVLRRIPASPMCCHWTQWTHTTLPPFSLFSFLSFGGRRQNKPFLKQTENNSAEKRKRNTGAEFKKGIAIQPFDGSASICGAKKKKVLISNRRCYRSTVQKL